MDMKDWPAAVNISKTDGGSQAIRFCRIPEKGRAITTAGHKNVVVHGVLFLKIHRFWRFHNIVQHVSSLCWRRCCICRKPGTTRKKVCCWRETTKSKPDYTNQYCHIKHKSKRPKITASKFEEEKKLIEAGIARCPLVSIVGCKNKLQVRMSRSELKGRLPVHPEFEMSPLPGWEERTSAAIVTEFSLYMVKEEVIPRF